MFSYNIYPYGHDFGNSNTAGVTTIEGQTAALLMPSAVAEGLMDDLTKNVSLNSLYGSTLNQRAHVIELNGKSWYVGDLAIQQNPNTPINRLTARGDLSRYWNPEHNLVMLLATAGTLIKDYEFGLAVVDNLPIATMDNPENPKKVKAALDGDYEFMLDGVERIAHITVKKTVMEGAGANLYCGATGKEKAGIIDIGGRTTDVYMVTGQTADQDRCESDDCGVEHALDDIKKQFTNTFAWSISNQDATAMMRAFVSTKTYDHIPSVVNALRNSEKTTVDLDNMINNEVRRYGRKIAAFVKQTWASSLSADVVAGDASRIILVGGGAHYFHPEFKEMFKGRLVIPERPEYANAAGFAKLAQHYLNRELKARVS